MSRKFVYPSATGAKNERGEYVKAPPPLPFSLDEFLFDKQLKFVTDPRPFKVAVCSRRSGKTIACAADLINTALQSPEVVCLYVTLSRNNAKKLIWPEIQKINRKYGLKGISDDTELSIRFPNQSIIYLSGAKDASEIEKFRGLALKKAYVDECFHGDTLVETYDGPLKIKDIPTGAWVKNAQGYGTVTSTSVKKHSQYVRLQYNNEEVKCSLNHLFFTANGWIKASELKIGDQLVPQDLSVRILRGDFREDPTWASSLSLLQYDLQREESNESKAKSYEGPSNTRESLHYTKKSGTCTPHTYGQWYGHYLTGAASTGSTTGSDMELCGFVRVTKRGLPHELQAGFSRPESKAWDRSGRGLPLFSNTPSARPEERGEVRFIRVDDITIQECRSDPTNPEGNFYDLEVSGHPSFTVNGALVHNCQSFRAYIRELIDDIISPALIDYAGTLCLIGTPGPIPTGYFAEVAGVVKGKESVADAWSLHGWTFFDNPFIEQKSGKTHQELLERDLKRRGVKVDDPSIQREFFGRWVLDSDSLLLHYDAKVNHFDSLPSLPAHKKYNYIMGIDLGYNDADAIAVLAWSDASPTTYLIEESIQDKQGITELVEQVQAIRSKYDISKMVIDEGGLGKKIAEEMRRRHHIPVQLADKPRKMETVAFLNDAMRTARFKAKQDSQFAQECFLVEIDRDKTTPDRIRVSNKFHSDIIDAVIYSFKESPAFTYQAPEVLPKRGTAEHQKLQQKQMFEEALQHFQDQAALERRISGEDY